MIGFLGMLGVSLVTRIVGVVTLVVAGLAAYWWFSSPTKDVEKKIPELGWRENHLRAAVIERASAAVLDEISRPDEGGERFKILLAPFAGDNKKLLIRDSIRNALLRAGYNRGEVQVLSKKAVEDDPAKPTPAPAAAEKGWLDRLTGWLPWSKSDSEPAKPEEQPEVVFYIEGTVYAEFKAESPSLELKLDRAEARRGKDGKWRRIGEKNELDSFREELVPGTLAYAQVWMQNTNSLLRLLAWVAFAGGLPWATLFVIRMVLQSDNNALAALLVLVYTALGAMAAWALLGFDISGFGGWVLFLAAVLVASTYNLLMGEWMEDWARN